jgi:Flp pilus assembly secretin CpaC
VNLGFNKAVAIDLPVDVKEILVADPQTVKVVLRTVRRVYMVGAAVGRTNVFFYDDHGQQIVALDMLVSEAVLPPALHEKPRRLGRGKLIWSGQNVLRWREC